MTIAEQIQFVERLIEENERRAKQCGGGGPSDPWHEVNQRIANNYRAKAQGLREVGETLHRYQSLMA